MIVSKQGKEAETDFRLVASAPDRFLIEARPFTGRTHQIRVHLAASGCAVVGDELYGQAQKAPMGLRAVKLAYQDPFTRKPIVIRAPVEDFLTAHGFDRSAYHLD
jgi:23S rRNA-/tRNA-specific pseudouridylate synthase